MKLKKIVSLALAGLMAVSMLAGCNTSTSSDDDSTVVTNDLASALVNAMNNDAEYDDEDLKITFTYSSTLENELKSALSGKAEGVSGTDVAAALTLINGESDNGTFNTTSGSDKQVITNQYVVMLKSSEQLTQKMLLNAVVSDVETNTTSLVATTKSTSTGEGDDYYDFTYTGEVAVVTVNATSGLTYYYVAYTITQTTAKQTFEV